MWYERRPFVKAIIENPSQMRGVIGESSGEWQWASHCRPLPLLPCVPPNHPACHFLHSFETAKMDHLQLAFLDFLPAWWTGNARTNARELQEVSQSCGCYELSIWKVLHLLYRLHNFSISMGTVDILRMISFIKVHTVLYKYCQTSEEKNIYVQKTYAKTQWKVIYNL